ncbi:zinc finger MYM-type protein 1-like [Rhopalosiphum padi]|uniref:zinc finger MYM-type protein 1-like n=1 Tax=Rhopalosiphum padi TaxID=40932 RepID=UPI00298DF396|nr:zinc finger MYM-type protein 1-like [Rhopalosiphum padi]
MSDGRKRFSGSEYKKRAKDKEYKESKVLNKIPKLSTFFKPATPSSLNAPDNGQQHQHDLEEIETSKCESDLVINNLTTSTLNMDPATFYIDYNDPAKWIINDVTRDYVAKHGINQNLNDDITCSKREYPDKNRFLNKSLFVRTRINGEVQSRPWLVFSKSTGTVFCAPCRLFGSAHLSTLVTIGFNDWKNAVRKLNDHENSIPHKTSTVALIERGKTAGKINQEIVLQLEQETNYWRNILKRIVATVRSLVIRGLPLRGSEEKFGSYHSGNFIMTLELLAEFDPFLSEHIRHYGKIGSGNTSYLSSQTYGEFIQIMAEKITKQIVEEVKVSKYFSISVDSTPDVSHVDQLSFIIRYISKDGTPIERFLKFIANTGHKSEQLADAVFDTLNQYNLDIKNCRGQSYDNASNMAGKYTGLQARIKEVIPLAIYVPCSAHSLNLVGISAVDCCEKSTTYFRYLQELYNFFTASTHRWEILLFYLKKSKCVKSLSQTRWSARYEAGKSLCTSWSEIKNALQAIIDDANEKPVTKFDASVLLKPFNTIEMCFMTVFWNEVLERFHIVNKKLQSVNIELGMIVELYGSLEQYISRIRNNFEEYEGKAIQICGEMQYKKDKRRTVKRKRQFDETMNEVITETGKEDFRINVFFVILDKLNAELVRRGSSYKNLCVKFDFLTNICSFDEEIISEKTRALIEQYPNDIEESFTNECLHLRDHLFFKSDKKRNAQELCKMLYTNDLIDIYPNVTTALRMYLCTFATNCTAERSFSALKRVKSHLRSTLESDRLNATSILHIESEMLRSINYDDIIDDFASKKVRRKML